MDGKCVWQGCFGGLALWSPHVSFTYTLKHTFYPLLPPSAFPQGFSATLNAIVANIPCQRQTLLFSATQTKSVKDLARLSLVDPEYLAVHAEAAAPTPLKLQQVGAPGGGGWGAG